MSKQSFTILYKLRTSTTRSKLVCSYFPLVSKEISYTTWPVDSWMRDFLRKSISPLRFRKKRCETEEWEHRNTANDER